MIPFRVNADYEFELFYGKKAPAIVNQSIEFLEFFLEDAPLWTKKKYSQDYLEYVETKTGKKISTVHTGTFQNWWGLLQNLNYERYWNSKLTTTELIIQKGWCSDTHILKHPDDLKLISPEITYLVKDPFGMSGQKFQTIPSTLEWSEKKNLVAKAMFHGPVILEPLLDRCYDFSQYIFPDGKVIAYENLVDQKFQYKGTVFRNYSDPDLRQLSFYNEIPEGEWSEFEYKINETMKHFSSLKNEIGYSIDSFIYRQDGELHIRALSEINYRRTMGRVAYELAKKFEPECSWSKLIILKSDPTFPLFKHVGQRGVLVLSPGDTRFELVLLKAKNEVEGRALCEKLKKLLPDT